MLNESTQVAASVLGKYRFENAVDQATPVIVLSCFAAWTVDRKRTNLGMMLLDVAVPPDDAIVLRMYYDRTLINNFLSFGFDCFLAEQFF